jgi:hypothetical protein
MFFPLGDSLLSRARFKRPYQISCNHPNVKKNPYSEQKKAYRNSVGFFYLRTQAREITSSQPEQPEQQEPELREPWQKTWASAQQPEQQEPELLPSSCNQRLLQQPERGTERKIRAFSLN